MATAQDANPVQSEGAPLPEAPEPGPWGFWATMGWTLLCGILFFAVQIVVAVVYLLVLKIANPTLDIAEAGNRLGSNGLFVGLATLATAPACIGFILIAVVLRRCSIKGYLGLTPLRRAEVFRYLPWFLLFLVLADSVTYLIGRPIVPPIMVDTYKTRGSVLLLAAAVVLAAPIWEELVFRGFLFKGIVCSRLGGFGAVLLPALVWSVIHTQYDWYQVLIVFLSGLFFGVARLKSDSTMMPMLLHLVMNLIAMAQVVIKVEFLS